MANERFYTAEPMDFEGESFTLEGLQVALDEVVKRWAGKQHTAAYVSPALSLGRGACVIATEAGRVLFVRDDAAKAQAQMREEADRGPDGRLRKFKAEVVIARAIKPEVFEETAKTEVIAEGLMGVFFNAAMFVQETLGDVPECMQLLAVEKRERSMRSQISRAKTQERDVTSIRFPGSHTAPFFEMASRPNEYYSVIVHVYVDEPEEQPNIMRRG